MRCEAMTAFGEPLAAQDHPTPVPQGRQVLVRVTGCGVCHSDVHLWEGYFDMGGGQRLEAGLPLPHVLGHEIEGVVAAVGPEVAGLEIGAPVAVYPWIGCGSCAACARGDQQLCMDNRNLGVRLWGGYADHVLAPDASAVLSCAGLPAGAGGVAMCSGLTAYAALAKIPPGAPSEPIALVGVGGVGLMGLALAKALRPNPIVAVDTDPAKRALALERGAARALDPAEPGALEAFVGETGGALAAVDFVGAPASLGAALGLARRGGTVVVVGLYGGAIPLPIPSLPLRALTVAGSYVGRLDEAEALLALMRAGRVDPPLMTHRPLSRASEALSDLKAGRVLGRVVLTPA